MGKYGRIGHYQLQDEIVQELVDERCRQNDKFPEQHLRLSSGDVNPGLMLAILVKEVGEVAKTGLEQTDVRSELIQVAAVAIAWIEGIDARG